MLRKKTGQRCEKHSESSDFSFISAVTSSALSTVYVCAFVIIFSVISGAFSRIPLPYICRVLPSLFEITTGTVILSKAVWSVRTTAAALCAASSFSGLCVASQVFSAAKSAGFSAKYYIPGKIFQAFLSFFALYLIYPFITY